jgi:hypothetical protein
MQPESIKAHAPRISTLPALWIIASSSSRMATFWNTAGFDCPQSWHGYGACLPVSIGRVANNAREWKAKPGGGGSVARSGRHGEEESSRPFVFLEGQAKLLK